MLVKTVPATSCQLRQNICDFYRIDETNAIEQLLPLAEIGISARSRAWERARQLVINIRQMEAGKGGVDALLNEYSLSSEEGIVLMCLAEALLRVPDSDTQDALIRDKLANGEWSHHLGKSDSLFVNASSWGLLITGKVLHFSDRSREQQLSMLKRTIGRLGEPVIRSSVHYAMKIMGKQFVMGRNIDEALVRAKDSESKGYVYSYDMLGEAARTMRDADRYYASYLEAIHALGKAAGNKGPIKSPGISVKLSALHPRFDAFQRNRVIDELVPRLMELAITAKAYDIGFTVDAEEANRLELSLDVIESVFTDPRLDGWNGFGLAIQAYQKRAVWVVDWVIQLARNTGRKLMVRLVKGAYWDTEIKDSQANGFVDFPVYTRKASTDVSYKACAIKLMAARDAVFAQFATHNAYSVATILELAKGEKHGFEFQRLHGMGESLYDQVVSIEGVQCRVYAPVGVHEDLLAYLVRRLLENGANSSFVNAIVDETKAVEELLPDPVEKLQDLKDKRNTAIPLAINLFGSERVNSSGLDLHDGNQLLALKTNVDNWVRDNVRLNSTQHSKVISVINPANHLEQVGELKYHSAEQMKIIIDHAQAAFAQWRSTPLSDRANLLRRIANALEKHRDELIALCIKEAGKLVSDSIDEVREAVDFCRYYASQAENNLTDMRFTPRGVTLCISPWNFPLAIFLGQVAAAFVAGNTVIAKPAEQTSLIALKTLKLMIEVGLPEDVVQLIISPGHVVGEHVVTDQRILAMMFTGSTTTASLISRLLAKRGGQQVPFIAETGGQNCMIVDSTALPEQVCDDVIRSGFQSAGQRCSALRVLFVQEDIADQVIAMISGAMQELCVSDPQFLHTDVGPVIDQKALDKLNAHAAYLQDKSLQGKSELLYQCDIGTMQNNKHFLFAPRLYEIESLNMLREEVFGPIVHVIRFKAADLNNVVAQINNAGFGLTAGIHTRMQDRANYLARSLNAGNIYINRNMIGAVVGVQPFGGRGLSGTGPKAGGPNYLSRLVKEEFTPDNTSVDYSDIADIDMIDIELAREYINPVMAAANAAHKAWRDVTLNARISFMRQWLAKIATVDIVDEFADDLSKSLAESRTQLNRIEKQLKKPLILAGPTGESNLLYLESRGPVVCYADEDTTFSFWLMAIISSLAVGNTVVSAVSDTFYEEAKAIENKLNQCGLNICALQIVKHEMLDALLQHVNLSAAVVSSNCSRLGYFSQQLANRDGPIIPVVASEYADTLIHRLLLEKTVSIDTTASGGNTILMTLIEDEE